MINAKKARQMTINAQDKHSIEEYMDKVEREIKNDALKGKIETYIFYAHIGAPSPKTVKIIKKEVKKLGYKISYSSNNSFLVEW